MSVYLGIDTSNYTTSVALFDRKKFSFRQEKMLLPVKENELGLRQSDAVFHHTKQLPLVINKLFSSYEKISSIGVSSKPCTAEDSYMPCFLVGTGLAEALALINRLPVHKTSHQVGHVLAALYSSDRINLIHEKFITFHVSGGTTDCLLIEPNKENIIKTTRIGTSLDLKAGQAVDRVGVMLGLKFPCGAELEKLSLKSDKKYKVKPTFKNMDCSISGLENRCRKMYSDGESKENIAMYCIEYICAAIEEMTLRAILEFGELPLIYAGGVMSNTVINKRISEKFNAIFASPEFSCDNAAGVAIYASLKEEL